MPIYKSFKDESLLIGICLQSSELYDGYLDISVQEKEAFEKCEQEYFKWQELLQKRYKKA